MSKEVRRNCLQSIKTPKILEVVLQEQKNTLVGRYDVAKEHDIHLSFAQALLVIYS